MSWFRLYELKELNRVIYLDKRLLNNTDDFCWVKVCTNWIWGTVCSSMWETLNSNVVCKQLGHVELGTMIMVLLLLQYIFLQVQLNASQFGQGTGPILMSAAGCLGIQISSNILINHFLIYYVPTRATTMMLESNVKV